jgi:hypothetical protein
VRVHRYVGYEPAIRQHVVEIGHWEGRQVALIDDRSAAQANVCGRPVASPSGRWFACADADIAYGSSTFGIWRVEPTGSSSQLSQEAERLPCALAWLDDDHLRVGLCEFEGSPWARLLYAFKDSTWKLEARCGGIDQPPPQAPRPPGSTPPGCEQGEQPVH